MWGNGEEEKKGKIFAFVCICPSKPALEIVWGNASIKLQITEQSTCWTGAGTLGRERNKEELIILAKIGVGTLWTGTRGRREFLGSFDRCWIRRLQLSFLDIHNDSCYFLGLLEMDVSPIKWNTTQSRNFRWLNKGQNIQVSHALSYLIVTTTLWKSLFGCFLFFVFFLIWGIRAHRTEVFASSLIFEKLHSGDWMFARFQNPFSFYCTMWLWPVGEDGEEWRKIGRR